mmetsp:Transcript_3669/g.10034  ORF Transcript_3669/g.10034 Transcript_3669/m.10034 type:complete len:406 (+) Transcript_3669:1638-2855(+)
MQAVLVDQSAQLHALALKAHLLGARARLVGAPLRAHAKILLRRAGEPAMARVRRQGAGRPPGGAAAGLRRVARAEAARRGTAQHQRAAAFEQVEGCVPLAPGAVGAHGLLGRLVTKGVLGALLSGRRCPPTPHSSALELPHRRVEVVGPQLGGGRARRAARQLRDGLPAGLEGPHEVREARRLERRNQAVQVHLRKSTAPRLQLIEVRLVVGAQGEVEARGRGGSLTPRLQYIAQGGGPRHGLSSAVHGERGGAGGIDGAPPVLLRLDEPVHQLLDLLQLLRAEPLHGLHDEPRPEVERARQRRHLRLEALLQQFVQAVLHLRPQDAEAAPQQGLRRRAVPRQGRQGRGHRRHVRDRHARHRLRRLQRVRRDTHQAPGRLPHHAHVPVAFANPLHRQRPNLRVRG